MGEDIANDYSLKKIDALFQDVGLTHTRKIDVICSESEIQAVILSYFSSPGINFSFLENRTEIIIGRDVPLSSELISVIGEIIEKNCNARNVPGPIVTDKRTANALICAGAILLREYEQRIWTRRAYENLYDYITNKYL